MALDHFVAKTYLRHWCDPAINKLHAYSKVAGGTESLLAPKEVCREEDGDNNPTYLAVADSLGQWRKIFEPRWNGTIEAIRKGRITGKEKFIVAGYWANVTLTTPSYQDIGRKLYENSVRSLIPLVAKPPPPGVHLEDLQIEIDPAFVKAKLTQMLLALTYAFCRQSWTILLNKTDQPFLTSDNPSAMFGAGLGLAPARILPLAPDISVSTLMDPKLKVPKVFDLATLRLMHQGLVSFENARDEQARFVNEQTVANATDLVFSTKSDANITALVASLREYGPRFDYVSIPLAAAKGKFTIASLRLGKKAK
jgi:Protein of unknown function (DUF4238)